MIRLALGPLLYYWSAERIHEFYRALADTPIDCIYLGETVCSKRRPLSLSGWVEIGRELAAHGKEVVLSTLTLIEAESELGAIRSICENGEFSVEANDMSAVQFLAERGVPFSTGPAVNIYNSRTLRFLHGQGLRRWVLPVELSRETLVDIITGADCAVESEVFGYGHLPLAYSARCFTARARDLAKDNCQFVCSEYPEGLVLDSQEEERLFVINGIQTQSGAGIDLVEEVSWMAGHGVDLVRLSPQAGPEAMLAVIERYDRARRGESISLRPGQVVCNGYWFGNPGMASG